MGAIFSKPVSLKRTASKPVRTSPRNSTVKAIRSTNGLSDATKKILIRKLERQNGDLEETALKPLFSDIAKPNSYVQLLQQSPTRSTRTGLLSNATLKRRKMKNNVDKIFLSEFGDSPVSNLADSSEKPKTYLQLLTARSPREQSPRKIGKISEVTRKRLEAKQTPRAAVRRVSPPTYAKTVKARPESHQQILRKERFLTKAPSASNLYKNAPNRGLFAEEADHASSPSS